MKHFIKGGHHKWESKNYLYFPKDFLNFVEQEHKENLLIFWAFLALLSDFMKVVRVFRTL